MIVKIWCLDGGELTMAKADENTIRKKLPATTQHWVARQALPLIAKAAVAGTTLTYQGLATALDRPSGHARAMAQVCDLLDSAATLSHRPLMALWTVRNARGKVNKDAWTKNTIEGLRDELLKQAERHQFTEADATAMFGALERLTGMGNRKAWKWVGKKIPQEEMLARLRGVEPPLQQLDSINDLGTDEPPVVLAAGRRYVRDQAVRDAVIKRAGGVCEFCKQPSFRKPDGSHYLEAHHIIALAAQGEDRMTNVIALCPGHHREAHFGEDASVMEERMVRIVEEKQTARS